MLFERFAIDVLQMTQPVKGAMSMLRLQWDATWHIIEQAVARGKARKEPSLLTRIGIDEKAFAKRKIDVTITNAVPEKINCKIMSIKRRADG
jgi:transposase